MKEYDVKYDIGQKVKVIQNKKILETAIESIRINHVKPFIDGDNGLKRNNGITIEYLVNTDARIISNGSIRHFNWINQNDIALSDEELIRKMTVAS